MRAAGLRRSLSRPLTLPLFLPLPRTLPRTLFPSSPAFWSALGGPASSHRRGRSGGELKGCDHADGTPAASFVAGATRQRRTAAASGRRDQAPVPRDLEVTVPDAAAARSWLGLRGRGGLPNRPSTRGDLPRRREEAKMARVDLFRGAVGACASGAFDLGRDRPWPGRRERRAPYDAERTHLIGETLEGSAGTRKTSEIAMAAASRAFEWALRPVAGKALCMITSWLFMPPPPAEWVAGVKGSPSEGDAFHPLTPATHSATRRFRTTRR